MKCYTVNAHTQSRPYISAEYKELSLQEAKLVTHILSGGFRTVECTNELTGEIMMNNYYSDEFFTPIYTVPECLKNVDDVLKTSTK
jgi:hypothetical protein